MEGAAACADGDGEGSQRRWCTSSNLASADLLYRQEHDAGVSVGPKHRGDSEVCG